MRQDRWSRPEAALTVRDTVGTGTAGIEATERTDVAEVGAADIPVVEHHAGHRLADPMSVVSGAWGFV